MTLSGFSFRPLVFIIPWTNKPVHNHTHRYPALTFLSCLLCTPEDRWQRQTSSCVKKWESSAREKIAIKKKKNHFKKTTASTKKCSVWGCSLSLNLSPPASCWRAASTESLATAAGGENSVPSPVFLDGGDPSIFFSLPHFKQKHTMPKSCSSLLDCCSQLRWLQKITLAF